MLDGPDGASYLLAGLYGARKHHQERPDLVLTVRDADARADPALTGRSGDDPGDRREEDGLFCGMPPTFMEPEPCLITLRNLMRGAYDREKSGGPPPVTKPPAKA